MSMSTMVVTDVMSAPASGSAVAYSGLVQTDEDTTITPFKTVLKQATSAKQAQKSSSDTSAKSVQKAESVKATQESSATGTTKLENIFKRASEKYGVSYDFLVAVAKAESDFNPKCVSSAGAMGIMQLMPDEVKDMNVSDPYDAEQNIMASTRLLAAHLKKFDGDYTLAAAAYNAGSGAVKKYGGVPPYKETQNYVKKINQYMKEGVKVPDKDIKVSYDYSAYEGKEVKHTGASDAKSSSSSGTNTDTTNQAEGFDQGVMATDEDWDKVRITVGTGNEAVTMTYGAYQKYKELGSLGVG